MDGGGNSEDILHYQIEQLKRGTNSCCTYIAADVFLVEFIMLSILQLVCYFFLTELHENNFYIAHSCLYATISNILERKHASKFGYEDARVITRRYWMENFRNWKGMQ